MDPYDTFGCLEGVWAVLALFLATLCTFWKFEKFRAYVGTLGTFGQYSGSLGTFQQVEHFLSHLAILAENCPEVPNCQEYPKLGGRGGYNCHDNFYIF